MNAAATFGEAAFHTLPDVAVVAGSAAAADVPGTGSSNIREEGGTLPAAGAAATTTRQPSARVSCQAC